jgi:hypothetical protein
LTANGSFNGGSSSFIDKHGVRIRMIKRSDKSIGFPSVVSCRAETAFMKP